MGDDWWPGWAVDRKAEGVTGAFRLSDARKCV